MSKYPTTAEIVRWQLKPGRTNNNNERKFVKHDYKDQSQVQPRPFEIKKFYTESSKKRPSFPLKLHRALIKAEHDNYGHAFAWLEHGRAFKVINRKVFISEVLPKYIGLKYDSYLRQCNLYGFRRLTKASGEVSRNAVYHELFLRGKEFLSLRMRPEKVNGNGVKPANLFSQEPKFFEMPFCHPQGTNDRTTIDILSTQCTTPQLVMSRKDDMGHQKKQLHHIDTLLYDRSTNINLSRSTIGTCCSIVGDDIARRNSLLGGGIIRRNSLLGCETLRRSSLLCGYLDDSTSHEIYEEISVIQDMLDKDNSTDTLFEEVDDDVLDMLDAFANEHDFSLDLI